MAFDSLIIPYLIGELHVAIREMRWAPTCYRRIPQVLLGRDTQGQDGEHKDRKATVESVAERVTAAYSRVAQVGDH